MATLFESIVSKVSSLFSREKPGPDSSIETRDIKTKDRYVGVAPIAGYGSFWAYYAERITTENTRLAKYRDYDLMDSECPELSSALDIYADNAVQGDSDSDETIEIISKDENLRKILEDIKSHVKLDTELWSMARMLAKYGDNFEEIVVNDSLRIDRIKHLPVDSIERNEDSYGRLAEENAFVQRNASTRVMEAKFSDWQVIHFRVKRDRKSMYGVDGSVLKPVRKVYRQLTMMEDAMIIQRLTRAVQRYGFLIDVEGIPPGEPTFEYLQKVKQEMRKRKIIDPITGRMRLDYNPMSAEEDVFLGVRATNRSDIKVLPGAANLSSIGDIEYLHNKVFAGIKVPKAYLGFEKEINSKSTLTEQDVQFARSVRRIQLALIEGVRKFFDVGLVLAGVDISRAEYAVRLPLISAIDELRKWEIERIKAEIVKILRSSGVSMDWLLSNVLNLSDEEIEEMALTYTDPNSIDGVLKAVGFYGPKKFEVSSSGSTEESVHEDGLYNGMNTLREILGILGEQKDPISWQKGRFPIDDAVLRLAQKKK